LRKLFAWLALLLRHGARDVFGEGAEEADGNPLRNDDPDGREARDKVLHVRVNVYYDTATVDQPRLAAPTLRQVTEEGIQRARNFYAHVGFALDVHRTDAVA
jgi:hypothetical protein